MAGKTLEQQLLELEAKTDKTENELKAVEILKEKVAKKNKPKTEVKSDDGEKEEKDFEDYQKFATLKFLQWGDHGYERKRLKEGTLKEFDKLEKKFKNYPGEKPNVDKTVFIGLGLPYGKIVKGYGVPKSLYKLFLDAGTAERYFE